MLPSQTPSLRGAGGLGQGSSSGNEQSDSRYTLILGLVVLLLHCLWSRKEGSPGYFLSLICAPFSVSGQGPPVCAFPSLRGGVGEVGCVIQGDSFDLVFLTALTLLRF